ncbi:MAG: GAF domain-containing protein [Acidobacteria bacterium]|nr:GAF domain-containing protein [Acidobacteriota bacterium]
MSVRQTKTRQASIRPAVQPEPSPDTGIQRTIQKLTTLSSLAVALSRAQELDPLLNEVLKTVTHLFDTEIAQIMLFNPATNDLVVRASCGVPPEYVAGVEHLKPNEGIAGRVYVTSTPLVVRDAAADPRVTRAIVKRLNVHAMACVPLIAGGRSIGVLVTATYDPDREITDDIELLEAIGHQLGMTIENARLFDENLRTRKLWESTFNAISDGISVHTRDMQVVKANQALAHMLGVPPEQLVGSHCCAAMLGRASPLPDCADLRAASCHLGMLGGASPLPDCADSRAAGGPHCQTTEVIERPNGQILRVTVDPLLDEQGVPYGSVHVVSDITEQVMLERHVARAEQLALIGELAAGLAHEVKNPLAGIKGALEIVMEGLAENDLHRTVLKHILDETMRVNRIISDLLDYARPHAASHTRTDLNELVEHAIAIAQLQLINGQIKLEFQPAPNLPSLIVDPDEVQKVILNLLINAVHAVKNQGRIVIRTDFDAHDRSIKLSVTDDGEGIPPESLDKIFRPFFTTKKKGTGLGLATCNRIITSYGGTITVDSKLGKGSTFTVTLPVLTKDLDLTSRILTAPAKS